MPGTNGKGGTVTKDDFTSLKELVNRHGAWVLASKVAKVCNKFSAQFKHEYANSAVAGAYAATANKISTAMGAAVNTPITRDDFDYIGSIVLRYGPELVVKKLAKIAGNTTQGTTLSRIF